MIATIAIIAVTATTATNAKLQHPGPPMATNATTRLEFQPNLGPQKLLQLLELSFTRNDCNYF